MSQNCSYHLYVAVLGLVGGFNRKLELEYWNSHSEEKRGSSSLAIPIFKVGRLLEISDFLILSTIACTSPLAISLFKFSSGWYLSDVSPCIGIPCWPHYPLTPSCSQTLCISPGYTLHADTLAQNSVPQWAPTLASAWDTDVGLSLGSGSSPIQPQSKPPPRSFQTSPNLDTGSCTLTGHLTPRYLSSVSLPVPNLHWLVVVIFF